MPEIEPGMLRAMLDVMPDAGIVVAHDGHIRAVNEQVEELFGYPAHALLGQSIELLVPERFRHAHRRHRESYDDAPKKRPMGSGLQLYARRADASEFPADISLSPVSSAGEPIVVALVRDTTDLGAATSAVAQLASIVRTSRDGILTVTLSGVITSWNPGAEHLFGFRQEDIVGTHISRLVPAEASPVFEELLDMVAMGMSPPPRDTAWLVKGEERVDVSISVSPMEVGDELTGFSFVVTDISERTQAEAAHRSQQAWDELTTELRLSSLQGAPVHETLALLCERLLEPLCCDGAAVLQPAAGELRVIASAGRQGWEWLHELAESVAVADETRWAPQHPAAEHGARQALVAPIPRVTGDPRYVLALSCGHPEELPARAVERAEGLAGQAALALELTQARAMKERLLLAEDRDRIGRDLHDLVIQRLFATGMSLQAVEGLVSDPAVARRIDQAIHELDTTIREIRTTIFALEPRPEGVPTGH